MDWNAYIDSYCERLLPGFWQEPLNAISNLAFWLAAAWVWRQWRAQPPDQSTHYPTRPSHWELHTLLVMLVLIGAGSFAFHTMATRWAGALDVLFIALYLHFYLAVYAHKTLGWSWRWAWLGVPAFALLSQAGAQLWSLAGNLSPDTWFARMAAASGYLGAWTVLLGVMLHSAAMRMPGAKPLALAAATFAVSLSLRQMDAPLCSNWRWGTHFAWHVLNAVTLGLTSWAMVLSISAGSQKKRS